MRKASTPHGATIAVSVVRLGSDPIALSLSEGATVADALAQAGIDRDGREQVRVAGVEADDTDVLENGDVLSISTPKQAGKTGTSGM